MPKRLTLFLLSLIVINLTFGQKLKKHYTSNYQDDGTIYFIYPLELFKDSQSNNLLFDITYKNNSDSAIINFTYKKEKATACSSISLILGNDEVKENTKKIYIEAEKVDKWIHRYTACLSFGELEQFFKSEEFPTINLTTNSEVISYTVIKKRWNKYSSIINAILATIAENE